MRLSCVHHLVAHGIAFAMDFLVIFCGCCHLDDLEQWWCVGKSWGLLLATPGVIVMGS